MAPRRPPHAPPAKDAEPVELSWIRERLSAALRAERIGVMPSTIRALSAVVWDLITTERQTSALLVGAAHDHYGLGDDDGKIKALMAVIELREEHAPGKVTLDGLRISTPSKTPPKH